MINRVTQQTIQRSTLSNVQMNLRRAASLQAQLSSGKVIQKVSDDPNAAGRAMALRADKSSSMQALRNADDGASWLNQIDSTIQSSLSAVRRARDLTVQGANSGALNDTSREAIAVEIEGLRDTLLNLANTTLNGRSLFAGTSASGPAFESGTYDWNGTPGGEVTRRLGTDAVVRVDADGAAIFGEGEDSIFHLLDTIAAELRAGEDVSGRLDDLDKSLDRMLGGVADVGIRAKQVTDAQASLKMRIQDLTMSISGIEDIDLAETILELQIQEIAYQASLGAAARVLQPSLMDFLR